MEKFWHIALLHCNQRAGDYWAVLGVSSTQRAQKDVAIVCDRRFARIHASN